MILVEFVSNSKTRAKAFSKSCVITTAISSMVFASEYPQCSPRRTHSCNRLFVRYFSRTH